MNFNQNIQIIKNPEGIRYYKDVKYPRIPFSSDDIYVITVAGDRLDLLALDYYGDSSLWKIISIANEFLPQDSLYIEEGTQIRIPSNYSEIITDYNNLNQR